MSLRIIKAGVLDSIQDMGRYGSQYLGINPGGVMDRFSAQLANALLGKDLNEPVIELHFPSSHILFETATIICICGADFSPTINDQPVPVHIPIAVNSNTILKFNAHKTGARCYVSVLHELKINKWMKSYSTNLKAHVGGKNGRQLIKDDQIFFNEGKKFSFLQQRPFLIMSWRAADIVDTRNEIEFTLGSEWHWLTKESQELFQTSWYQVTNEADRMGYRLAGQKLEAGEKEQLVSSAVSFGTVQLLPGGQLIILMADHQTIGGYPRIAHVISAHLPILTQKEPNHVMQFRLTNLESSEAKIVKQQKYLREIQIACKFRIESLT
ncbi:MAG: 5-oxoprolinase subunit C family protein [Flavisolibacter sp.]